MVKGQRAEKGLIAQSDGGKSAANLLPAQMHWSYPKQQNIHLSKAPRDSPPLFVLPQLLSVSSVVNLLTAVNTMTLPKHTRQSLPSFCPTFCLCSLWSLISVQEGRMKRHRYCSIPAGKCCAALQLPHLQRRERGHCWPSLQPHPTSLLQSTVLISKMYERSKIAVWRKSTGVKEVCLQRMDGKGQITQPITQNGLTSTQSDSSHGQ